MGGWFGWVWMNMNAWVDKKEKMRGLMYYVRWEQKGISMRWALSTWVGGWVDGWVGEDVPYTDA